MENERNVRFRSANRELREFLRRIASLANGTGVVNEVELQNVTQRLWNTAPEIGEASRGEILNPELQEQIAEYVKNFRALQRAVAKLCCVTLSRGLPWETNKLPGRESWY